MGNLQLSADTLEKNNLMYGCVTYWGGEAVLFFFFVKKTPCRLKSTHLALNGVL